MVPDPHDGHSYSIFFIANTASKSFRLAVVGISHQQGLVILDEYVFQLLHPHPCLSANSLQGFGTGVVHKYGPPDQHLSQGHVAPCWGIAPCAEAEQGPLACFAACEAPSGTDHSP